MTDSNSSKDNTELQLTFSTGQMKTTCGEYGARLEERRFQEGGLRFVETDDGNVKVRVKVKGQDFREVATIEGTIDGLDIDDLASLETADAEHNE